MIKEPLKLLDDLPPITAEQEDEIADKFPHYAFYVNKPNDEIEYYCTGCHCMRTNSKSNRIFTNVLKFKHNEVYQCPYCGHIITAKAEGRGRRTLQNKGKFALFSAVKGRLYIRVIEAKQQFYNDTYEPEYFYNNEYLYVYERKAMQRFNIKYCPDRGGWNFSPMKSNGYLPGATWNTPGYFNVIGISVAEIYKTDLKYSEVLNFATNTYDQIKYLQYYVRHNNIEYIVKAGFNKLAEDIVHNGFGNIVKWKSNNLLKMLGIRKEDLNWVRNFDGKRLLFYQKALKNEPNLKNVGAFVSKIESSDLSIIDEIKDLTGLRLSKIKSYIDRKVGYRLILWRDYLQMSSELPAGITEPMPKDLSAAHDRVLDEKRFFREKHNNAKIKERSENLKRFIFETEELCMIIPSCGEEIVYEGKALKHCVGGYVQRHADGKTNIFFIRRKSEPLKPYFTIEVSNNYTIIQCHGYRNERFSEKPKEIIEFEKQYKIFLEELRNGRTNSKRTA